MLLTFEVTGNSIDPMSFSLRRHVLALDGSPNPALDYRVEFVAEGAEVKAKAYMSAADRIMAVLPKGRDEGLLVKEIGDLVANDSTGKGGLKHDTIRSTLNDKLKGRGLRVPLRWQLVVGRLSPTSVRAVNGTLRLRSVVTPVTPPIMVETSWCRNARNALS
ncbi:MAG TPA: hypothetical protein VFP41_09830 [Actinomycetota bacterium]|nr:hypothetical protein [Actinomycetota bacterium]